MALDDRFKGSLYQGVEKPSLLSRVGTALQGFGAGYQGRGQEFLANLERKRQREQDELMQASISDAKEIKRLLRDKRDTPYRQGMYDNPIGSTVQAYNQEGIKESVDILNDRISLLRQRGQDDSDTFRIRDRILQGDISGADAEIDNFLRQAKGAGYQTEEFMQNVVTLPDGRMGQIMADGTINYLDNEPYRAPVTAGSAEGKIYQDYQNGVFGPVGSLDAIAARDAAIAEAQYRAPTIAEDEFGNPMILNESTNTWERANMSAPSVGQPAAQPPQQTAQDLANKMEFGPDGMPIDRMSAPPEQAAPYDPTRFVPYDEALGAEPAQYAGESDRAYAARVRTNEQNRHAYNQTEAARVKEAQDALAAEDRAFAKTRNLAETIIRLKNNQGGINSMVGELGKVGRFGSQLWDATIGLATGQQAERASAAADIESLQNMLLTEELDLMTGPLTDKDLEVLLASATTLGNTGQPEADYNRELDRVLNTVKNGIRTSARQGRITPEQAAEMEQIFSMLNQNNYDPNSVRAVNERFQLPVDEPPTQRLVD